MVLTPLKVTNPIYHFMAEEKTNEEVVEEKLDELPDDTDWKAKAEELNKKRTEDGIRSRERTKTLKEEHTTEIEKLKPKEPVKKEVKKEEEKPDTQLLEKIDRLTLQAGGIKEKDEVELAEKWKEQTGRELDEVLLNEIFVKELQQLRDDKANQVATTDVKGDGSTSDAKNTAAYWKAKGAPPTKDDIPDLKTRVKIIREMMKDSSTSGKKFYND